MCGIVGLFLKNEALQGDLGRLTSLMLRELCDRGPDSAGFAVYGAGTRRHHQDLRGEPQRRDRLDVDRAASSAQAIGADGRGRGDRGPRDLPHHRRGRHRAQMADRQCAGRLCAEPGPVDRDLQGRRQSGRDHGPPRARAARAARTRSATPAWRPSSAVTVAGSHPFSTGDDTCLVHNGSLSNHNRLREQLVRHGERFQTDNDSEVAAAYLASRMRAGDTLEGALRERA